MKCLKYALIIILIYSVPGYGQTLKLNTDLPSYLLQGDHIEFKVNILNLSDSEITGQVQLELSDDVNQQSVDGWLMNTFPNQYFTIASGANETILFPIQIPPQFNRILKWRCTARTGSNADTSTTHKIQLQGILPVLTNKINKTESYSLIISDSSTHHIEIKKLAASGADENIENKSLQIEVACDPSMMAVDALHDIMNQNFTLSTHLAEAFFASCVLSSPTGPNSIKSINQKSDEKITHILSEIKKRQMKNGSFPWIEGGAEDLKSTIDFLTLAGQLKYLNAIPESIKNDLNNVIDDALRYVDIHIHKMINDNKFNIRKWLSYFYMSSFYPQNGDAVFVYGEQMFLNIVNDPKQIINKNELYGLDIYLFRSGKITLGKKLLSKIDAQDHSKLSGNQLSLLLELYRDMRVNNYNRIGELIKYILQQRKENRWQDASATLSAYYGMRLLQSANKICEPLIHLQIGSIHLYNTKTSDNNPISYFRKTIDGSFIKPEMGSVSLSVQNIQQMPDEKAYAIVSWSYLDESEKTKAYHTIRIRKSITLNSVPKNEPSVKSGDTLTVQLDVFCDKDYEHVELTDLPPAGAEPLTMNSTHTSVYNNHIYFYINHLRKGKNSLEYSVIARHSGFFEYGLTELLVPYDHLKIQYASLQNIVIE